MLRVSIVTPVLNAAGTLPALFDSFSRLEPTPAEIVFVDNGSTDGSLERLYDFARQSGEGRVKVIEERRRGAAAARNAGIREAKGDVLAFTDADCSPDPSWLGRLVPFFDDPTVGAVAGRVSGASASTPLEHFSSLYTLRSPDRSSRHREWTPGGGGFPTANLAVRRALAEELDGFDEEVVIYGEDYDFCARVYGTGYAIVYEPDARVVHHHRRTLPGVMRQAFGFGRGHAYMLRRHGSGLLWVELPALIIRRRRSPVTAWVDLAGADKKVLAILVSGAFYAPFLALLPAYAAYLTTSCRHRSVRSGLPATLWRSSLLATLLVVKSACLTGGRWWGSVFHRSICF